MRITAFLADLLKVNVRTARRVDVNGFGLFASMAFTTGGRGGGTSANNCSDLDQQNRYEIM